MSSIVAVAVRDVEALRVTKEKVNKVRRLIQNEYALTKKQLDYCDDACVERSLRARGYNVRKAAKLLKSILAWRENLEVDYLIADEFSAELASGAAYVAGHDMEGRPVVIIKRNYNFMVWSQKQYLRYLIFTLEVAVTSMSRGVDQWVLIIDIGHSKKTSPSSSTILATLKVLFENYPERLAKIFIVDSPSVFYYLWKGICPFVDQAIKGRVSFAFSKDYMQKEDAAITRQHTHEEERLPSLRRLLQESSPSSGVQKPERSTTSSHLYCSGQSSMSNVHSRSVSFSTPSTACNSPTVLGREGFSSFRADRNFWIPGLIGANKGRKLTSGDGSSFRFSVSKRFDQQQSAESNDKTGCLFRPYWKFYNAPYSEIAYRSIMKPPLSGLKSIIAASLKSHLHQA